MSKIRNTLAFLALGVGLHAGLAQADETITIGNNRSVTIGSNDDLTIGSNLTITAGSKIEITAGTSVTITVACWK